MHNLEEIAEAIRAELEQKNAARDAALVRSRALTRCCADAIRAVHREQWDEARDGLRMARAAADEMTTDLLPHPDLYYSGYTQDALKEFVEASLTFALVRGETLPTPQELGVPPATYLNGLAEAANELRRKILDIIRHQHHAESERLLEAMDTLYNVLMAFDFPDVVTGGLRHRTDNLRGVLERTRGDVTNSLRQQRLQAAIADLEQKLGLAILAEQEGDG